MKLFQVVDPALTEPMRKATQSCTSAILTTQAPFTYQISGLTTGTPYYVRVTGHNSIGYGVPALTSPAFQVPLFKPPCVPPPVRLVSSTAISVPVEWDYPRENSGVEVWADNWDGGAPFLVYDGIDQTIIPVIFTLGFVVVLLSSSVNL